MADPKRLDPFASLGDELDLEGIPGPRRPPRPDKAATKATAAQLGFKSREPVAAPAETPEQDAAAARTPRITRRARKSTKEQFNLRAERADIDRLVAIAEERRWLLGDAFGEAVAALAEKLAS